MKVNLTDESSSGTKRHAENTTNLVFLSSTEYMYPKLVNFI